MKKAITIKDVKMLSHTGLDHYAKAVLGVPEAHWELLDNVARHDSMPLMTIGDMMEFLGDKFIRLDKIVRVPVLNPVAVMPENHNYQVTVRMYPDKDARFDSFYADTICDTLWLAVKEILNILPQRWQGVEEDVPESAKYVSEFVDKERRKHGGA